MDMIDLSGIHPASQALMKLMAHLEAAGHTAHLVGGAVRDALLGRVVKDLDISTSAHPSEVVAICLDLGFAVHPTGIAHGTVTVVVEDEPFEVTTWRKDVATDGRRAVIAFAKNMEDDARRRDFTINALYADRLGRVIDPTGEGLEDIRSRSLRFVGDADKRISEDALRILRYFRFSAVLQIDIDGTDDIEACIRNGELVLDLSRERIGWEMEKILHAPDAGKAIGRMINHGIMAHVLPQYRLSSEETMTRLDRLDKACFAYDQVRDAALATAVLCEEVPKDAFRLSNKRKAEIECLRSIAVSQATPEELGYRFGEVIGLRGLTARYALDGKSCPQDGNTVRERLALGARQRFPLGANDLPEHFSGREIGEELKRLEQAWIDAGFRIEGHPDLSPTDPGL